MSDFIDDHLGWVLIIGIILAMGGMLLMGAALDNKMCAAKTAEIGMESRWSVMGGCQVHDVDRWIPLENWRVMD